MNYQKTLDYLYSHLPMYQRIGKAAYKADLATTIALDEYFRHPHRQFQTIHIAGTNGKGSVSHMLAAVLQEAGYKTGLYTSPHLNDFRERIRINGIPVAKEYVVEFIDQHCHIFESLSSSFFEMTVAMAFDYFAKENVEIAVIETGMGGRLDSTNIITPLVSVITNIGMDHTEFLGTSLQKIAREKAGIIKPGVPVVIGELNEETKKVFTRIAVEKNAVISFASERYKCDFAFQTRKGLQSLYISRSNKLIHEKLETDLMGFYQQKNILTLLQTIDILSQTGIHITTKDLYTGLRDVTGKTGLSGRWQIIGTNPRVICDTAHNPEGIRYVLYQINATPHHKPHFVIGFVTDKNTDQILRLFPRDASYYFTKASIPRALDAKELQKRALAVGLHGNSYETVTEALNAARQEAGENDLIFVGGSTFVVAEVI